MKLEVQFEGFQMQMLSSGRVKELTVIQPDLQAKALRGSEQQKRFQSGGGGGKLIRPFVQTTHEH